MSSVNKVTILGRVGKDAEVRYTSDNKPIANLSIATSESWKDSRGNKQEKTEWHKTVVFGALADVVKKYVKKGDLLYIVGKLQTRKWQGQDGKDVYTTEVVVDMRGELVMLGGNRGNGSGDAVDATEAKPAQNAHDDFDANSIPF